MLTTASCGRARPCDRAYTPKACGLASLFLRPGDGALRSTFAAGVENFKCASPRNDADDCNPTVDKGIEEQSQILDAAKRMLLVHKIDKRL
jgi:hypothetical protein